MQPVPIANPPNPWATTEVEYLEGAPEVKLEVFEDQTRQILAKNDSPDVGFTFSVNPYRGCFHACAYCYARPSHEYLSLGAGTDFDRKIMVKLRAAELLRAAFAKKSWRKETVVFSGVTDCYQPLEASYRLTRGCLEVCVEHANPAAIITKSALIERDVDVLLQLARVASVFVTISIPFWDPERARAIEPYVPTPARRLRVIETLARAGLSVGVNVAPIIPGLNDQDIPQDIGRRARRGCNPGGLRARATAGVGEAGVRAAAARRAAAGGGPGASPDPRNARRPALRPALRRARPRRGGLRRRDRARCSTRRRRASDSSAAAWEWTRATQRQPSRHRSMRLRSRRRMRRQPTSKTCRTIARPPFRSGNRAAARAPS